MYSPSERIMFALVPQDGTKITSEELANKRGGWDIANPRVATIAIMRSLMKKMTINGESFCISKTNRNGPYPLEYWFESSRRKKRG